MRWPLVAFLIAKEDDVVAARQRARAIADKLGFSIQDQTRIATAVSEIARNAYGYAGSGKVEYGLDQDRGVQFFVVRISDQGEGVVDLSAVLEGAYKTETGMGMGILGARRLMDKFDITSARNQGTVVTLAKQLPPDGEIFTGPKAAAMAAAVAKQHWGDPRAALQDQNRELLRSLSDLAEREEEALRVNRELAETNRGVVALYAELEAQAGQLKEARANLESQVEARTAELAEANALLRAEAIERERMEADLRQSQKMEAIGQLTGGIAHDFNNLLTGIVGSLDIMQRRIARGQVDNLQRYIEAASSSANRAAALTHRLLAFARRQPLDPRPTDVNALIFGMEDLLRRTISESIELRISSTPDLWLTLCDPHQLENAILNLAINARDAMPDGGILSIETCNGRLEEAVSTRSNDLSAEFVRVRVSDTGTGMTPDVLARAFEPFFTTKPLGQGTGLGLSMIYGFARQSDGHARIESEVGKGTTISLYLPRRHGKPEESIEALLLSEMDRGEGETVLVVEDEPVVRDLIVEILVENGYRALQATDGPSGLRALHSEAAIDLLITDVGLPGLNGRQLADQARASRPDLKVLFITGYANNVASPSGFLDSGMAMITKPFSMDALLERIRGMVEDQS